MPDLPTSTAAPRCLPLPERLTPVFGLADTAGQLDGLLPVHRLVTVVGAGGMGKTTLALAAARRAADRHAAGVCFVDLSPVAHPSRVVQALADALGLPQNLPSVAALVALATAGGGRLLVVLDSCEHLLTVASELAEALLAAGPDVDVLATSRERLGARGERVIALPSMAWPAAGAWRPGADEVLAFPAVQLLVDRVQAVLPGYRLTNAEAPAAAAICARLEGIPLAIELAAARTGAAGLQAVHAELAAADTLLSAPSGDGRDPRHRTLATMLDWSSRTLAPEEQQALGCLSVFRGNFTLDDALAVIGTDDADTRVVDLAAKSLVAVVRRHDTHHYRLLDVTRAYAAMRQAPDARPATCRRHADLMLRRLRDAEVSWATLSRHAWAAAQGVWMNDLRAAIDWALGPDGDVRLGIGLTIGALGLADHIGLMFEFDGRAGEALARLHALPDRDPLLEARLLCAAPRVVHWDDASSAPDDLPDLHKALALVRPLRQSRHLVRPLTNLWLESLHQGDYPGALAWAGEMDAATDAPDDPMALVARRYRAFALHFGGQPAAARTTATAVRDRQGRLPFAFAPSAMGCGVSSRIVLARDAWLCGAADDAVGIAEDAQRVGADDGPFPECLALAVAAIPIALWRGDTTQADRLIARLGLLAGTYGFAYFALWRAGYAAVLAHVAASGTAAPDAAITRPVPVQFPDGGLQLLRDQLQTFDCGMRTDADLERVAAGSAGWCSAEVLRVHAMAAATDDAALARLHAAQDIARAQGALAWELRVATTFAWRACAARERGDGPGRSGPGDNVDTAARYLSAVLSRFTQGRGTRDVRFAQHVLHRLEGGPGTAG